MGAFSRIRYVIAANVNSLIEKAENPEKLLRALIREMEDAGEDARLAHADLQAEQQHLERVAKRMEEECAEWQERAEKAVASGRDDLARAALKSKAELAEAQQAVRSDHTLLGERLQQLEQDLRTLQSKLADAKLKLRELLKQPENGNRVAPRDLKAGPNERKLRRAINRFDQLQNQVERLEARVRSYETGTIQASPWAPSATADDPVIEEELEALRERLKSKPADKGTANPDRQASAAEA